MEKQNWVQRLLGRKSEREARKQIAPQPLQATEPRGTGDAALAASAEQSLKKTTPVIADSSAFVAPLSTADAEANVPAVWRMGDVILGQYEVAGKLGEGGMGTVYKVHHRGWNTDLAVKSSKPAIFARARGREDFTREAETWVNLELHPHIVSCYYVRTLGGIPRVFAEYVTGGSLSDWLRTRRLYEGGHERALERILDVAIQFAWGLHAAHEQGLVHLDVKPANVMMTVDGTAKVTDFGLAKARVMAGEADVQGEQRDEQRILVSVRGMTPAYCSPEQAAGQHVSRKTDIWSWGVSLLELFVGKVTWLAGPGARDVLASHERRDPMIPLMPASVVQLLSRCFQQQPADRPATMLEVATELQTISAQLLGRLYPRQAPRPATTIVESLNNRALSLYDLGKIEEAKRVWEQALQANPQHLETTYNRGVVLWRRGELPDDQLVHQLEALRIAQAREWQAAYFLAQVHLERGNADTGQLLLEDAAELAPGRRIIEELLEQTRAGTIASARCLRVLLGHKLVVKSVALDAGGCFLASGSWDHTVRLWETASGRCLHTFEHAGLVNTVCLSADGSLAASGGEDRIEGRTAQLWKIPDLPRSFCALCFSQVFSYADVLQTETRATGILQQAEQARTEARFAAALELLREVRALPDWNFHPGVLDAWAELASFCSRVGLRAGWPVRTFQGHAEVVSSASLSADGCLALSGSWDRTMRLWETTTGRCLRIFEGHTAQVLSVCLSVDGQRAVSGSSDKTVRLWETATGCCLHTFEGHASAVRSVCLSADGHWIVSGSADKTVQLWDTATGRGLWSFQGHSEEISSVGLSADGRLVISSEANPLKKDHFAIRLWDPASGRCLLTYQELPYSITSVRLSPDGQRMVYSFGEIPRGNLNLGKYSTIHLMEVATARSLCGFQGHTLSVTSLDLSADGKILASGSQDHSIRLWETTAGRCLHIFQGHTDDVTSVRFSTDGRFLASGSRDATMRLWELDWELAAHELADWDDGARSYLETFLTLHTPYAGELRQSAAISPQGLQHILTSCGTSQLIDQLHKELRQALTHRGTPTWNAHDFQELMRHLQQTGYGWLRPEGVWRKLEEMAHAWQGPPPLPGLLQGRE